MAKRNAEDASLSPQHQDSKIGKIHTDSTMDLPNLELESLKGKLKKDITTVTKKLGDLYVMQSESVETLQFHTGFIESVSNRLLTLEKKEKEKDCKIFDLENELFATKDELGKVKNDVRENTNDRKSANMIVNGLREEPNEDCNTIALSFLRKLIPDLSGDSIADTYRLGKGTSDGEVNRALFIKFKDTKTKMQIMKKKGALYRDKALGLGSVYCNDDLTEEKRRTRQDMREIARFAQSKGYREARVAGDKLFVGGV